jgi:hypothetical protein
MRDEIVYLRQFGDDAPAADEATKRRIYSRTRRVGLALIVLVLAGAAAGIALTTTARGGQSLSDLVAQVQQNFGDGRLLSASLDGSTLSVKLAAPDEVSAMSSVFEAQMLASAARDSLSTTNGQITSVQFLDASGTPINGYSTDLAADPTIPALANGACNAATQALLTAFAAKAPKASLNVESALALPYAGGSCAFKFQTADPEAFAENAPFVVGPLVQAMGAPNQRAILLEVDDQAGTPQFVYSYSSSQGSATYIKPGLSLAFEGGGPPTIGNQPPPTKGNH